jgi:enolase
MTAPTRIEDVIVRRVWDSRGRPTVEVELHAGGSVGRAIAPSGASTGSGEAAERRDDGHVLGGHDVRSVVAEANVVLPPALRGIDPLDQSAIDGRLRELEPDRLRPVLGANVTIAASMAAAWTAANLTGRALWEHLLPDGAVPRLPLPEIQILGGGAHAAGRLDIQDLLVVAPGAASVDEALEWTAEVYLAAGRLLERRGPRLGVADEGGWWPAFASNEDALELLTRAIETAGYGAPTDVAISLDIAATQLWDGRRYRLRSDGAELDTDAMIETIVGWCDRYPIVSVEDPLAEHDAPGYAEFTRAVAGRVQVVGDDLLVTNADTVRSVGGSVTTMLLKPNQAGTLTDAAAALAAARTAGLFVIASARSGESEDVTIVHIAVGWGTEGLKVGSITRGERTAKWNELLRVAAAVERAGGSFVGRAALAGTSASGAA